MVSQYQSRITSCLSEEEETPPLGNFKEVLRNHQWIIEQRKYCDLQVLRSQVQVDKIVEAEDGKHKVVLSGYDCLGKVQIKGVLSVSRECMEMKFVKEYDDYCEYVSSQLWQQWIYEGVSGVHFEWQGTWSTIDTEDSPDNSGLWCMRRKHVPLY